MPLPRPSFRRPRDTDPPASPAGTTTDGTSPARPSAGRRWRLVLSGAARDWNDQRAASKGAALAFYALFSLAPILVLVIAIAGAVYGTEAAQGELFTRLTELVGPSGAAAIQALVASASRPEAGALASIIATLVLLMGATTAFAELKESLDEIWRVPPRASAGWLDTLQTRLLSFGLILVLAALLLASLVLSAALAVVEHFWSELWQDAAIIASAIYPLASLSSFAIIACLFAVIYKMLPSVRLSWRDVWIGAIGTALLFALGKYAIGLYLGRSGVTGTFGAAGSVIALLLWIYYSAQIFFFGAEFTRHYALQFGSLSDRSEANA